MQVKAILRLKHPPVHLFSKHNPTLTDYQLTSVRFLGFTRIMKCAFIPIAIDRTANQLLRRGSYLMKEYRFKVSETQNHNDDDKIKVARPGKTEKTKLSLRHIRKIHKIKSDRLGYCYSVLGDSAWQILCEIHLHNLDRAKIDIAKVQQSISVSQVIAKRYLDILQTEQLIEKSTVNGHVSYEDLSLTDFGQSKVQSTLEECAEAFTSIFIYSKPCSVASD